ncbi:angiotensinogen-like [Megalops cyprinoides]|uniref:angiotensinogen-like n=1 Tax=Megalops cyprinoides TaxID=118141 RepID=UPI001863A4F0|nr:angiotensinogen-like [Megalops cyprinoides]XP_036402020.1 angiotensinogen-like [Megalops cyprinoides]
MQAIVGPLLLMSLFSVTMANRVYVHPFGMFALENTTCVPVKAQAEKPLKTVTLMPIEPHDSTEPDAHTQKDSESPRQNITQRSIVLAYLQNHLGLRLYDALRKQKAGNTLFSPMGAYGELVTLYLGASGSTAKQLQEFLGLGKETDTEDCISPFDAHKVLRTLHSINSPKDGAEGELRTQAWTFISSKADLSEDFARGVQDFSDASYTRAVDLSQPQVAEAQVNSFIKRTTAEKIKQLFKDISPSSDLLFASSVHFKGNWRTAFQPEATTRQEFWITDNTSVTVPLMTHTGNYKYLDDRGRKCTVVKLPLSNKAYMLLVLPHEGTHLDHIENQLTAQLISDWSQHLKEGLLELSLPRFSMKGVSDLKSILSDMKLGSLLGTEAEFRKLSTKEHFSIGQVLNNVLFEMSEEGSAHQDKPQDGHTATKLTVNRPFLFGVVEGNFEGILLLGRVTNPTL